MKIFHDASCLAFERAGHPERPARVSRTVEHLRGADLPIEWLAVEPADEESILRVHTLAYVRGLDRDVDFDPDTPAHPRIESHARLAAGAALDAVDACLGGEVALSLMRPPGHHARPEQAMGFCYLNHVAMATLHARDLGHRVAVFDFDVHHGNGTEEVLRGQPDTAFFSVHQYPAYPGSGRDSRANCFNYPMRPETPRRDYTDALGRALDAALEWGPDVMAVSAGFDAYRGDPLAQENVEAEDYRDLGRALRDSGVAAFAVLEGGYSDDLPQLVHAFLEGLSP